MTTSNLNMFTGSKFIKTDYEDDKKKIIEFLQHQGIAMLRLLSDTSIRNMIQTQSILILKFTKDQNIISGTSSGQETISIPTNSLAAVLAHQAREMFIIRELIDKKTSI